MPGYKDFVAGDALTADQVDGYLMRQSVMVFASTAARDAALSGVLVEGMTCYLTDADLLYSYDGSAWHISPGPKATSALTGTLSGATIYLNSLERWGRVVTMYFILDDSGSVGAGGTIGTVPAGYRPSNTFMWSSGTDFADGVVNSFRLASTGVLAWISQPVGSSGRVRATATWLI